MKNILAPSCIFLFLFSGCPPEKAETPTKGTLHVLASESIAPAIIEETREFVRLYGKNGVSVIPSFVTSDYAVSKFILDTVRMIFTSRQFTPDERDAATKTFGEFLEMRVAYDGVVAVVHHKNPLEKITVAEIRKILQGRITRWEQLSMHGKGSGPIRVVLQDSSDESSYLRYRTLQNAEISVKFRRSKSPLSTLQTVVSDPSYLGFVGLSWPDSARVPAKVLEIGASSSEADTAFKTPVESVGKFYGPHPAHIYRNYYPLKRTLYMYTRSLYGDIASGFGTFVANKEGQYVFLQSGLVPATQPIRLKRSD